ncbi:MAG: formate dehydrogenase-N subunit alpha [Candidatus Eisenbacteria sp.]|nr:formate dehydrogenase-N subunit alpha [Candidatus Eisenbacteria bacterium]
MTNHWTDIANSDCIMIIGSNAAENHPLSFKWVMKAVEKGAKLINIDPRFTRTSSKADIYAPLRSGTDIAFIGGLIRHVVENELYHKDYILNYTDAAFIVDEKFDFSDGLFSGYDASKRKYDSAAGGWRYAFDTDGNPKRDPTMQDPRCVLQLLRKHYASYTPEKMSEVTGMPVEKFHEVANAFCATGTPEKSATIMYAMGTTQHTYGTQNVRSYAMLQLLLGNIGIAGGGINALRGESNVQGSTDYALLYHILPGYLKTPRASNTSLKAYLKKWTPKSLYGDKSANWWQHTPKYMVSLLKAYWGDRATKDNGFAYDYLPKLDEGTIYTHIGMFEAMDEDRIKGLFCFGQNPAVAGPNARKERRALGKLDWLVAVDLWQTDTMDFWKRPGVDPKTIDTEVFVLPAASSIEKEGSISNSGRWMQWRYKAVDPPGVAKSDLWIVDKLFLALRERYEQGDTFPEPIVNLHWNYGHEDEPDVHMVAKECNGYAMRDYEMKGKTIKKGEQIPSFAWLTDDGSTCSGNWLYCNSYTEAGNMAARRDDTDAANGIGLYPKWAWCWPVNRRIIYNRASVDTQGKPWNDKKWVIRWNESLKNGKGGWEGDVPDGGWAPDTKYAFIMKPTGHAQLFGYGRVDGPFPTHYEPVESPVKNAMYSQQNNPAIKLWASEMNELGTADKYPIVCTTYRVVEHWQAGQMTRNLTWVSELMPDMFIEMSRELGREKGIANGDRVKISTARGSIVAFAVVTPRFKPFKLNGKLVHQIGVPWHWGYSGIAVGDSANVLTPHVGDANTMIPEYKAFLCDVEKEV